MASKKFNALTQIDKHTVGNLVSSHQYIQDIPYGAVALEDVDNFHIVELSFEEGERSFKYLTDVANEQFLVAAVERRLLNPMLNEGIIEYYNGKGERARIIRLKKGLIFDTSAFDATAVAATGIEKGNKCHYDPATKKFLIHGGTHADFATADKQFQVLSDEDNLEYTLGAPMVRLEVIKGE